MSDTNYEVELKVLLWNKFPPETFVKVLSTDFKSVVERDEETQLNHYFEIPHRSQILPAFEKRLSISTEDEERIAAFRNWENIVVRTREITNKNGKKVILVMKSTVNNESSQNGTTRKELEIEIPFEIDYLDSILTSQAEIRPQAKWSRTRRTFEVVDDEWFYFTVCLDKNAGYGYIAEFEVVINNPAVIESTKKKLQNCITKLWLKELSAEQLQRMFDFYNKNWESFYQTENYFFIG